MIWWRKRERYTVIAAWAPAGNFHVWDRRRKRIRASFATEEEANQAAQRRNR